MATSSMDKGLYAAPQGLPADDEDDTGVAVELEGEAPAGEIEIIEMPDGTVEINLEGGDEDDGEGEFGDNLADFMDEGTLQKLSSELSELVDADITSRKIGRAHV